MSPRSIQIYSLANLNISYPISAIKINPKDGKIFRFWGS